MLKPIGTGSPASTEVNSAQEADSKQQSADSKSPNSAPEQPPGTNAMRDAERRLAENALAENAFAGIFRAYELHAAPDGPSGSNTTSKTTTEVTAKGDPPKIAAPPGSPFGPGKKVLMLGDSHTVMDYGKKMKELIKATGSDINVDAKVGAAPKDFMNRMTDLIKKDNPDTIVVSLGTNFREGKMSQRQIDIQVERITKAVRDTGSSAKIVWVGPPRLKEDMKDNGASLDSFDKMMQKAMANKGQYVSSNPYTTYEGRDGVHYNKKPAEAWAQGVFNEINSGK
jgi:hypothetical protein